MPARRHRHRRRQPVGRRGARQPAVREHLRAAAAARAVRAARRPADLRDHPSGRDRRALGRGPARACSRAATARSARTITPGKRRRALPRTSGGIAYASTLPRQQFEEQLASLTAAIADAVGARPVSYRSGRFGFSADHVAALEREGYLVESSVAPLFYEAHKGGPEFVEAPLRPYFLAYDSATRPGTSNLLEVPVSAALNRRLPQPLQYAYARAPRPYTTKRVLREAAGSLRLRWLRPSYSSLDDMIALARDLARAGRAGAQPAVPLERGHRRRQPVQPNAGRARRASSIGSTGSSRSPPTELGATPVTFAEFRDRYSA